MEKGSLSSIKAVWKHFAQDTAIHGVKASVDHDRHVLLRWFWRILLLTSVFMVLKTIVQITIALCSPQIGATSSVIMETKQKFPAVTICNINHFRMSFVKEHLEVRRWMQEMYPKEAKNLIYDSEEQYLEAQQIDLETVNIRALLDQGGLSIDDNISKFWIYTQDGEMKGSNASRYFKKTVTEYGQCYTSTVDLEIWATGTNNGIRLVLDANTDEYYLSLVYSMAVGFTIAVHDLNHPMVASEVFYVAPGTDTIAAIGKRQFIRDDSWNDCVEQGTKYSREFCMKRCNEDEVIRTCNCSYFFDDTSSARICRWRDEYECMKKISVHSCARSCAQSCVETNFDVYLSQAQFPSPRFKRWFNASTQLGLDIMYQTLRVTSVEQYVTYDFNDFLGGLGGTLGLFLGSSLLSLFEVVEVSLQSIYMSFWRRRNKRIDLQAFSEGGTKMTQEPNNSSDTMDSK